MRRCGVRRGILACFVIVSAVWALGGAAYSASALPLSDQVAAILGAKGVMIGYEDGSMRWDSRVTRAEAVKILLTATGEVSPVPSRSSMVFLDVDPSHWAFGFVTAAAEIGLVRGRPGRTFDPDGSVTMAEFMAMVSRVYASLGGDRERALLDVRVEPSWAAPELTAWPELLELVASGSSYVNLDYPASRGDVAVVSAKMMEGLGLAYDLSGVVERVSSDGNRIFLRTDNAGLALEVPVSENVRWYPRDAGEKGQGAIGRVVKIVLDASGKAAVVVRQ